MDLRQLCRPLPLILIALFFGVAIVDLVHSFREEPLPPPQLGEPGDARFTAEEPVIDFRPDRSDPSVELLPAPVLEEGNWTQSEKRGVWAKGESAEIELDLHSGGYRALVLECLPARGRRPVRSVQLNVNGTDCGTLDTGTGWQRLRFELPEETVQPGSNRFALTFPDRAGVPRKRRALLVRKLGLFLEHEAGTSAFDNIRQVLVDLETWLAAIMRSGILEIPVSLEERTDALRMRFRFRSGAGRAEVSVSRHTEGGARIVDAPRRTMDAAQGVSGRIRIPLHGRRGLYVVRVRAHLEGADASLVISSLQLVEEGDPTRRPVGASFHRN
ncbi:MAG: hypothetical protein P8127_12335 [Acidobacteriota bacterium]